ncbi:hypothetical protein KPL76_07365 [Subtercola sp. PAMC28395]|uniref:hypothetical protein n=1 Tax=Subtercola sp. PAMC28395 TaxID=2846775 RepID=UPI001C0B3344|nr:hypothetical protein [Subtercola sp. PAMC28395]QWT25153.1 hypothetical protein KPL76_07365 [Subtercola sp. PAMC28395]
MPDRTVSDSIFRLLWQVVEIYVFVVLVIKDRKVPKWNGGIELSVRAPELLDSGPDHPVWLLQNERDRTGVPSTST